MNAIYDTAYLAFLGYGDNGNPTVELTTEDVAALAAAVGGTIEEIETARID